MEVVDEVAVGMDLGLIGQLPLRLSMLAEAASQDTLVWPYGQ